MAGSSRPFSSTRISLLTRIPGLLALVSGALVAGCDKHEDQAAVDAAPAMSATVAAVDAAVAMADAATEAPPPNDERRLIGVHRGPGFMLFQQTRVLQLNPDQLQKVNDADKLAMPATDPAAKDAMRDATKDLHTELVAGIKAGKLDPTKLEPKYAAIEKTATAEHDKETESLNALHEALTPEQRKTVVAAVRVNTQKRSDRMAKLDGGAPGMAGGDAGKPMTMGKRSLDRLTRGLELDPDQLKKVDAIPTKDDPKNDPAEMKKRTEALLDAFEKDKFDAKKSDGYEPKKARSSLEDEAKLVTQLLPILKPEQREKLAAKMDKAPSPRGGRMGGHRPLLESEDDDFN